MLVYVVLYLLIVSLGFSGAINLIKPQAIWGILLATFTMVLVAGLRNSIGYDWDFYNHLFNISSSDTIFNSLEAEPLFQTVMLGVKRIGLPFQFLILFIAVLSIGLKGSFIYKYSEVPLISMVVLLSYFLSGEMGQIRQSLAIAISLWSIPFVLGRKPWLFIITITLAIFIHYSAFIFVLVYPFLKIKFNWKWLAIVFGAVLLLNATSWFGALPWLISHLPEYIQHKFHAYYTPNNLAILKQTFYYRVALYLCAYIVFSSKKSRLQELTLNSYLLGILLFVLFSPIETLSGRGTYYFKIFEVLLVPSLVLAISDKKIIRAALFLFFILYHSRHYWATLLMNKDTFIPYQTIIPLY